MRNASISLNDFVSSESLSRLLTTARLEDLGPNYLDVTSTTCVPESMQCQAVIVPRQPGVISGLTILPMILELYDSAVSLDLHAGDADRIEPGVAVATLAGGKRSILAVERVALNILGHLSGIATQTAACVEQTSGTRARICDTRKTLPGLRSLAKYAVACGGGVTHRLGLYDAMLIKDNHLTHLPPDQLVQGLARAIAEARQRHPQLKFVEVEADTLAQLAQMLTLDVDYILLDNMAPDTMRQAVAMRDAAHRDIKLEASGGIHLDTVRAVAESGVDRISIGALTHSASALDLGLDMT